MALHDGIFDKVLKTFEWIAPVLHKSHNQPDTMVKLNMPPLMGRRDAAFDLAAELIRSDLFAYDELKRVEIYQNIVELLAYAARDTKAILFTLSSPDTELREHWLLNFIIIMRDIALTLGCIGNVEHSFYSGANSVWDELRGDDPEKTVEDARIVGTAQLRIAQNLRAINERGSGKIMRYRGYAAKSFSAYNAKRYQNSYAEYHKLYRKSN